MKIKNLGVGFAKKLYWGLHINPEYGDVCTRSQKKVVLACFLVVIHQTTLRISNGIVSTPIIAVVHYSTIVLWPLSDNMNYGILFPLLVFLFNTHNSESK